MDQIGLKIKSRSAGNEGGSATLESVLRIRIRTHIRRILMFLGLLDPDPDPLVRGMDQDPSIIKQISKKNLDSYCFVTTFLTFYL